MSSSPAGSDTATVSTMGAPSVEIRDLCKDFGPNRVLDNVNVTFRAGSIHALLGANGSGKSTLIKILAGFHEPTSGTVRLHGEELKLPIAPATVHAAGMRFVHQDLGLIDSLSVADNLALASGYERGRDGTIRWSAQRASARRDLEAVGLEIDPQTLVSDLGPVQQTLVAMARALRGLEPGRGVLVLDEPTARLPYAQVEELLARCRVLRDNGVALVYVSHRLDEVFAMADQVTVLRDGRVVFDDSIEATNEKHLTSLITGRDTVADTVSPAAPRAAGETPAGPVRLALRGVSGSRVRDVDLEVARGEIVAVTGLIGSGRSELGRLIFGAQPMTAGSIEIDGKPFVDPSPLRCVKSGIGYVPQDRKQGGVASFNIAENTSLTDLDGLVQRGVISARRRLDRARKTIQALDVRPADPARVLQELSGGNQQKVILGKWLNLDLRLLILDEPTYGVDVGAREIIMSTVVDRARNFGLSVLLLDSDIELVAAYADRVLVMRHGRIVAELAGADVSVNKIADAVYAVGAPAASPKTNSTSLEAS